MKRKLLPLTLMLIAGLITTIITFIDGYSITGKLLALLITFFVFYLLGATIVKILDYFDRENEKSKEKEEQENQDAVVVTEGETEDIPVPQGEEEAT